MVYRGLESIIGCIWLIGMGEERNGSSAHTWLVSTPETSSLWVFLGIGSFCTELTDHGTKGGKLLKNQTIVEFGLELNEGCWNTYAGSP